MGIQGLLPFVDAVGVDTHLSDFAGRTAAIDGYCWLHRGARSCPIEMARGTHCTGFVEYCMRQVALLRRYGVEPYVVLDGAALPAKALTEEGRRQKRQSALAGAAEKLRTGTHEQAKAAYLQAVNITPEHAYQFILALRAAGVRYVVAPYEADAQIAFLATRGFVDLVIADDSDMLAFGCPAVLTKLDAQGHGRYLERRALEHARDASTPAAPLLFTPWEKWDAVGGLLLDLCILAGCDYVPNGVPGLGIKGVHKLLRTHKSADTLLRVCEMKGREPPAAAGSWDRYRRQYQMARETFLHQRVYDPSAGKVVPLTPLPEGARPMPHCGADLDDHLARRLCAQPSRETDRRCRPPTQRSDPAADLTPDPEPEPRCGWRPLARDAHRDDAAWRPRTLHRTPARRTRTHTRTHWRLQCAVVDDPWRPGGGSCVYRSFGSSGRASVFASASPGPCTSRLTRLDDDGWRT